MILIHILVLTAQGGHYELKTPYRDGTTRVIFEPLDFIAGLAALVPKPRVNLTGFHSVVVLIIVFDPTRLLRFGGWGSIATAV